MKRWQRVIGAALMTLFYSWMQLHSWFPEDPGAPMSTVLATAPFVMIGALRIMKLVSDGMYRRW